MKRVNSAVTPLRLKIKGRGVDAITFPSGLGTVVKDVPEMGPTLSTNDLCATHTETVIGLEFDVSLIDHVVETRPTAPRLELRIGVEEGRVANDTAVRSVFLVVPVFPRERALRPAFLGNVILLVGQLFA